MIDSASDLLSGGTTTGLAIAAAPSPVRDLILKPLPATRNNNNNGGIRRHLYAGTGRNHCTYVDLDLFVVVFLLLLLLLLGLFFHVGLAPPAHHAEHVPPLLRRELRANRTVITRQTYSNQIVSAE